MSELINNSEFRHKKLKELIKSLHEGKTVDEVKEEFQNTSKCFTTEISQIEQALVKEGSDRRNPASLRRARQRF